jgi:acetyl/propionyl-CoA carboxylase alpha subunit
VQWEPGYATGESLSPWYDPVLGILAARGDDLAAAVAGFLEATSAVHVAGLPDDLDQLRARAEDIAARLHDGSA